MWQDARAARRANPEDAAAKMIEAEMNCRVCNVEITLITVDEWDWAAAPDAKVGYECKACNRYCCGVSKQTGKVANELLHYAGVSVFRYGGSEKEDRYTHVSYTSPYGKERHIPLTDVEYDSLYGKSQKEQERYLNKLVYEDQKAFRKKWGT